MKKNVSDQLDESFKNVQFIIILIATILSFILYLVFNNLDFFFYIFLAGLALIMLYIIGFFRGLRLRNHVSDVKNGQRKYQPYIIDKARFIEECKTGLLYSMIEVDNNVYGIEVQLDEINSENYDKFTCYIDKTEIVGLDNFLNHKLNGAHSLNDLDSVKFLDYANGDPKKYFEDRTIKNRF